MFNGFLARWKHAKTIGKTWWIVVPTLWAVFWATDATIEKWDLGAKHWWDGHTTHLPSKWQEWLIVLLFLVIISLIEGSFRQYRLTVAELDDALATSRQGKQHSKSLDWGGEWKLAEDGFRTHAKSGVVAQRRSVGTEYSWSMSSGDRVTRADVEALCSKAGALLLSCPGVRDSIPPQLNNESSDLHRWLEHMHSKYGLTDVLMGTNVDDADNKVSVSQSGYIHDVAALSASECVSFAATALHFKQLW